jgi:hypothetical protein
MLLFGDLNFDMLNSDKSATLNDFCDIFNLSQLVNGVWHRRWFTNVYAPAINHFLSLIYTSWHRVSIFSLSKDCFLLDGKSDLITVSRPPPYRFLSLRCTLYPSTLNRLSLKDSSSFVSEIINKSCW